MIQIKAIDLVSVAVAAEIWLKQKNEIFNTLSVELEAATKLKKALQKADWDEDAELIIDEAPF